MNLKWIRLRAAFDARAPRERGALIGGAVMLVLALGYLLWIQPAWQAHRMLTQRMEEQRTSAQTLMLEWDALRTRQQDPDAGRKAQIEALGERLTGLDAEFAQMQRSLVAPREMGQVIEGLLARHGGLQLLSLRNLPPAPLNQRGKTVRASSPGTGASSTAPAPGTAAAQAEPDAWLYMHGMQITVRGSYADMQAYLQSLENQPRRLLWGALSIDAQAWPASTMTVTIYTVSLERTWWSV